MISFKCRNCGGEVIVNTVGDLYCPYCGAKNVFSDTELGAYKSFRKRMLEFLAQESDKAHEGSSVEAVWSMAEQAVFETEDGDNISIQYLYRGNDGASDFFVAKNHVLFKFDRKQAALADLVSDSLSWVKFPKADMKGLNRSFPAFVASYCLKDGGKLVALSKSEDMYPLGLYGNLPAVHVAWIISRLENIACVLEYSGINHKDILVDSLLINPWTHEVMLCGGWWGCRKDTFSTKSTEELSAIRSTALKVLGSYKDEAPQPMLDFLAHRPQKDAFNDFEYWDKTLEKSFGERKFVKLSLDNILR